MKTLACVIAVLAIGCSKRSSDQAKSAPVDDKAAPAETKPKPRPRLVRSEPLPALARQMLRDRMSDHGDDMESLLWTVLMLDYESTASVADVLIDKPKYARPPAGDKSTLNSQLPPAFFDFQDSLYESASALSSAALKADDDAIVKHFNELSATCIGCHSLYLRLPSKPEK